MVVETESRRGAAARSHALLQYHFQGISGSTQLAHFCKLGPSGGTLRCPVCLLAIILLTGGRKYSKLLRHSITPSHFSTWAVLYKRTMPVTLFVLEHLGDQVYSHEAWNRYTSHLLHVRIGSDDVKWPSSYRA